MTEIKDRVVAPSEEPPSEPPALGLIGWLRWTWRQLTSMKTALVLLFLLALGAVPGSLIPQTAIDPVKVADFFEAHPKLGPFYDKLGLFAVYKSAWFSAIYLLLFISLIGCVVPRLQVYLKALRARPPKPPRNLNRLQGYQTFEVDSADDVLAAATTELRRRRFRVESYDGAIGAERGYLREAGNLLFHFSLILALIGAAWGALFGYRGTVLVVVGNVFSNSVAQYDDFSPGRVFTPDNLPPFSLTVKDFKAKFQTDGPQRGAAREFNANITYSETPDSPEQVVRPAGEPPAEGRRHQRPPARPRLRPEGHGEGRQRRGRVLRSGAVPPAGQQLLFLRRGQGPGRAPESSSASKGSSCRPP